MARHIGDAGGAPGDDSARAAALARINALAAREQSSSRPTSASSTSSSSASTATATGAGLSRASREAAMAAYSQFRASATTAATASAASSFLSESALPSAPSAALRSSLSSLASSSSSSSLGTSSNNNTGLFVNTSLRANSVSSSATAATDAHASDDPLTPRSRRALESTLSQLSSSNNNSNNNQRTALDLDSIAADAMLTNNSASHLAATGSSHHPLSPHKELVHFLDSLDSVNAPPIGNSASAASASSFASRSLRSLAFGLSTTNPLAQSSSSSSMGQQADLKERSRCGTEIQFNALVRLRLNNHACLRIAALAVASTTPASSTTPVKARRRTPAKHVGTQIDVTGDGLAGDDDQVFVLVKANMPTDCGDVHYGDVVALYCVGGSRKGHFLSVDALSQTLTTKKGPGMSNNEKWRLVHPSAVVDTERRAASQSQSSASQSSQNSSSAFFSLHPSSSSVLLEQPQQTIVTSDRVLFKMATVDLLLSVRIDPTNPLAPPTVVLAKPRDDVNAVGGSDGIGNTIGSSHDCVQVWELTKSNIPYDPRWNRTRAYLTGDALTQPHKKRREAADDRDVNVAPLSTFPPSVQETIVVDDLLYAFVGVAGRYMALHVQNADDNDGDVDAGRTTGRRRYAFVLQQQHGMDPSVAALAARCVPLGECYLELTLYVEQYARYEYGQVSHAFCAALKTLLKEYTIVIAQLEHRMRSSTSLSLQQLWFYIQPSLRTMELLRRLVDACRATPLGGGGALLSAIQRMRSSLAGDAKANDVFAFLLERASVPYLHMVERWIYYGDLVDPYDEFMVRRNDDVDKDDVSVNPYSTYWHDRYTLRVSQVPQFLTRVATTILTTGKYLNVFRTCRRPVNCPFAATIAFASSDAEYDELIDKAHAFASEELLEFYTRDYDLKNRFASLKHYFLMDQGDFFVDFMDVAESELQLRADKLSLSRLESLLHLSLQTSTCSSDPYKDDLVCFLSPNNLMSQMEAIYERAHKGIRDSLTTTQAPSMSQPGYRVIDAFTLDYKVAWPLSLVVSCGARSKYQMLFRHLFFCKHVERRLCDAWRNHQTTKELSLRAALGPSFCLRQRMLHFQQNFVYYMMFEVISSRWHAFERQLAAVASVDDILLCHGEFLDMCLKECLLTDPELLRVVTKLMTVCMLFADSIERFTRPYFMDDETINAGREAERDRRAEQRARDDAEAALASFQRQTTGDAKHKKKPVLKHRPSSQVDMRRMRITALTDEVQRALTVHDSDGENSFVRRTSDLENEFDKLLSKFMDQLYDRSHLQQNSHLSNLCTRLDYNGFYSNANK